MEICKVTGTRERVDELVHLIKEFEIFHSLIPSEFYAHARIYDKVSVSIEINSKRSAVSTLQLLTKVASSGIEIVCEVKNIRYLKPAGYRSLFAEVSEKEINAECIKKREPRFDTFSDSASKIAENTQKIETNGNPRQMSLFDDDVILGEYDTLELYERKYEES